MPNIIIVTNNGVQMAEWPEVHRLECLVIVVVRGSRTGMTIGFFLESNVAKLYPACEGVCGTAFEVFLPADERRRKISQRHFLEIYGHFFELKSLSINLFLLRWERILQGHLGISSPPK